MTPENLYKKIQSFCNDNRDEAIVTKYAKYFKEGYDAYGLASERIQKIANDTFIQIDDFNALMDICDSLLKSGKYEEVWIAKELVNRWNKKSKLKSIDAATFERIGNWFEIGINNWAHCDVVCGEFLSPFLLHDLEKNPNAFDRLEKYFGNWRTSNHKYKRRAVPVTMIKLLKTASSYETLFAFINPMMMDDEKAVHQGLGWFLRESWKLKPEVTEKFLMKWKDKSARLIFQYATEKMTTEGKEKFKRNR